MADITTRSGKGSPLTNNEVDANFTNLNNDKLETSGGSVTGDVSFSDNAKAIFGAGSDLKVYHNGFASIIQDSGDGDLYIGSDANLLITDAALSDVKAKFVSNGEVELRYDNAAKLATTATGIDVTGTVTADGLTVDGSAVVDGNGVDATFSVVTSSAPNLTSTILQRAKSSNSADAETAIVVTGSGGQQVGSWDFKADTTNGALTKVMSINGGGDISFYEDTGTTPKFFWDASAESLGIGTTSPVNTIHVERDVSGDWLGRFRNTNTTNGYGLLVYAGDDSSVQSFKVANHAGSGDYFVVRGDGNVGIGTSSPDTLIHASSAASTYITAERTISGSEGKFLFGAATNFNQLISRDDASGNKGIQVIIGTTEAMRIDDNANVVVSTGITLGNGSAYAASNTLDDYEEGTFTPVLIGSTTAGTGIYTAQEGTYTKIGNTVYFRIRLDWTAHTATGTMIITGAPFANNSANTPLSVWYNNLTVGSGKQFASMIDATTNVQMYAVDPAGGSFSLIPIDTAGSLRIAGTYTTNS